MESTEALGRKNFKLLFTTEASISLDPTCLKVGTGLNAFLNPEMTHLTQRNLWYSQNWKLCTRVVGL